MLDELLWRAVLDGIAAAIARKKTGAGKRGKNDGHGSAGSGWAVKGNSCVWCLPQACAGEQAAMHDMHRRCRRTATGIER